MSAPARKDEAGVERVRRPADLLLALFSLAVVLVTLGLIRGLPVGSTEVSTDVSRWLVHIPRWLSLAASVAATIGALAFVVVAMFTLLRHEARSALNAALAAAVAAAGAIAAASIWHGQHGPVAQAVLHGRNPTTLVIDTAFIAFLTGSDLVRRSRWSRWCVLSGAALLITGLAVDSLTPFAVVVALFGGLSFGWAVRWIARADCPAEQQRAQGLARAARFGSS